MLTDEQLEIISDALAPLFQYLEREAIVDVAKRLSESLTYTRTAELEAARLQKLGFSPARIRREAMKILNATPEFRKNVAKNTLEHKREVKRLLKSILKSAKLSGKEVIENAGELSRLDNLNLWKEGGKEITDHSFLPQLLEGINRQTMEELTNLTRSTGFKNMLGFEKLENLYKRELDKAMIKICTGTFSQEKVVYDAVHALAKSGLRTIDFESGYSMQLDTAVKLAIRTGAHQLAGKMMDADIERTGENLVQVGRHIGARNTGTGHANHKEWQGKVYYIKKIEGKDYAEEAARIGQTSIESLWEATGYSADGTQENDPLGLYGYNCRHHHYVFFEGISEMMPPEPDPDPVVIDGKKYDYYAATQKMRSMERAVRALKRERDALKSLGMEEKAGDLTVKIKQKTKAYKEFCEAAGTKPAINRMRYESGTSDLTKTKAWKKYSDTVSIGKLQANMNEASAAAGDENNPKIIGEIDMEKKAEAVQWFGEQIRNSPNERLIVIDNNGKVYYNTGKDDFVNLGNLDITDCIVIHNHPASNGILSFGKSDFNTIRDSGASEWYLVNEQYNYFAKKIKSMDNLPYNAYYRKALKKVQQEGEDIQHLVFELLREDGFIEYERKRINGRTNAKD